MVLIVTSAQVGFTIAFAKPIRSNQRIELFAALLRGSARLHDVVRRLIVFAFFGETRCQLNARIAGLASVAFERDTITIEGAGFRKVKAAGLGQLNPRPALTRAHAHGLEQMRVGLLGVVDREQKAPVIEGQPIVLGDLAQAVFDHLHRVDDIVEDQRPAFVASQGGLGEGARKAVVEGQVFFLAGLGRLEILFAEAAEVPPLNKANETIPDFGDLEHAAQDDRVHEAGASDFFRD